MTNVVRLAKPLVHAPKRTACRARYGSGRCCSSSVPESYTMMRSWRNMSLTVVSEALVRVKNGYVGSGRLASADWEVSALIKRHGPLHLVIPIERLARPS